MQKIKENYIPTEQEILEGCKEFQKSWTKEQEQKRNFYKTESFVLKVVKPIEEQDNV